ncbi:MAG TPA: DUF4118 domain-containing protein, partial [Candidatus Omnitrophota bacterium]|nr:DUF4118 domain-containing protein [Candidatus Omnitrophota bacterium]
MLAVITAANLLLKKYLGYQAIGYIFLLALLILSLLVSFVHIVAFAVVSAVIWNFLFIPPVGTFSIMKTEDILMSGVYIVISIIAGYLTSKIRKDERLLAIREARTDTLYRIASVINTARDRHALIEEIEKEIGIILPGKCRVFVKDDREKFDELLRRQIAGDEKELSVALWAFEKAQPAGWSTDVLSFARSLYIPLKGPSENIGVISYQPEHDRPLSQEEMNMLLTAASQLAIYLEREIMEERAFEA